MNVGAAACPARWNSIRRTGVTKSLSLEGKVVRPKPDRMRSKVTALYRLMVIIDRFDLISRN